MDMKRLSEWHIMAQSICVPMAVLRFEVGHAS
jgi:hypothetical protein